MISSDKTIVIKGELYLVTKSKGGLNSCIGCCFDEDTICSAPLEEGEKEDLMVRCFEEDEIYIKAEKFKKKKLTI